MIVYHLIIRAKRLRDKSTRMPRLTVIYRIRRLPNWLRFSVVFGHETIDGGLHFDD